ncbi:MAG TPA: response regulator [Verrucomicrobiae bacterium]
MVVDDETSLLKVTTRILEKAGYRVIPAKTGPEALQLFSAQAENIQVVLTDYSMPGMNGLELASALKKIRPETSIILNSGLGETMNVDQLTLAGVNLLIKKPFTSEILLKGIQEVQG